MAFTGFVRPSSNAWTKRKQIGTSRGAPIGYACRHQLGGGPNRCERLALEIGIVSVPSDVALELVPKAVVALTDRDLSCEPKRSPQARIAILRQLRLATEHAGLHRGEIKPAELQELTVMAEPTQIAGLGNDG